jgi:two-component system chemotaxis response regulator CheB
MEPNSGYVIVIGASAGGMPAIANLLAALPADLPAAIGVVTHLPQYDDNSKFLVRLQRNTPLPCHIAVDHMPLRMGHVYFAPAGHHLLIKGQELLVGDGPPEGRWRPSIDVALRSAAVAWNSHCIGVILTGMLDDGTTGMEAVQRCGGYTLVQDPNEADYSEMPRSVIEQIRVDGCLPLASIPQALMSYLQRDPARVNPPEDLVLESGLAERAATSIDNLPALGEHSLFSCPDCGGGLWEIRHGELHRYRCHIGHSYTEKELLEEQQRTQDKTLWIALRTMEEKRKLLQKIADREEEQGLSSLSQDHYNRAGEMARHIDRLKDIIFRQQDLPIE